MPRKWIDRVGEIITNETLCLAAQDRIRAGCKVLDCTIVIADPEEVSLHCSSFVNCTIRVLKKRKHSWDGCCFDSCIFKGTFYDRYFGNDSLDGTCKGCLRNCDFTGATLNLCAFFNCTPEDLRLPGWPHVTIFYPNKNAKDFADLAVDSVLGRMDALLTIRDVVALTFDLPAYVRKARPAILRSWKLEKLLAKTRSEPEPPEPTFSLENMRKLLQTKPYVFMS